MDLGTNLGWAIINNDGVMNSGKINLEPHNFEGGGMRWVRLHDHLNALSKLTDFGLVSFEKVEAGHSGMIAAHMYGGFYHHVTYWCEVNGLPYTAFGVGQIKKHATGSGAASKEQMIRAAQAKGHKTVDDNEADAIALAYLTFETWGDVVCKK